MTTKRRLSLAAGASAVGLTAALLPAASATAAPTAGGEGEQATIAAAGTITKRCTSEVRGRTARIQIRVNVGDNGRDVQAVSLRITDNGETGIYRNKKINIKKVRLLIKDQDGKTQLSQLVAPSSPGGYDIPASAGEGAGLVRTRVEFRSNGHTVVRNCRMVID